VENFDISENNIISSKLAQVPTVVMNRITFLKLWGVVKIINLVEACISCDQVESLGVEQLMKPCQTL